MNKLLYVIVLFLVVSCSDKSKKPVVETQSIKMDKPEPKEYLSKDYALGQFEPKAQKDFVEIPTEMADRSGLFMRKEAFDSYVLMRDAAKMENVHLVIRSATRNFTYQKGIWERKWNGKTILSDGTNAQSINDDVMRALKILEYSSMPGSSRHHWGTDIDLNAFSNEYFTKGEGKKIYQWLSLHAHEYGFCQVYSEKGSDREHGYNEEKWHYSYMPIAQSIQNFIEQNVKNDDIQGFDGDHVAESVDIIGKYVLGISKKCQH